METALYMAAAPILVAIVAGIFAWLQGQAKGRAQSQETVMDGFKMLLDQLQHVNKGYQDELEELRHEVRELRGDITRLEQLLRTNNIPLPAFERRPTS